MTWPEEIRAAVGTGTAWRRLADGVPPQALVGGLALLPVVGGAVGTLAAVLLAGGPLLALLGLEGLAGRRLTRVGVIAVAAKIGALVALPPPARALSLVLAAVLGRWAMVVQCYGGAPALGPDASPLVARARFREFGTASVLAIGTALVAADALGLAAVVAAALATLGVRTLASGRGGLTRRWLEWTDTVVEAVVLSVFAGLLRLLG
jgi:hypothetical protein